MSVILLIFISPPPTCLFARILRCDNEGIFQRLEYEQKSYVVPERKWPFSPISTSTKNFNPRITTGLMKISKIILITWFLFLFSRRDR